MNVFKISRGRSFKGLTAYMGGPKDGAHRAVWSLAMNCGTDDVQTAAKVMAFTATHAEDIKAAARAEGHKIGTARSKSPRPVLHLAISWETGETPTPEQQQDAARSLLKALGMEHAQAVAVAHNDTDHAHVHLAVNLVRPDLGTQWSLDDDMGKMSVWADEYSRAHGFIVTPGRAANAAKREAGEKVEPQRRLSRDQFDAMQQAAKHDWAAKQAARPTSTKAERDALFTGQADERSALWRQQQAERRAHDAAYKKVFRAAHATAKADDKARNKGLWRDTFKRQTAERAQAARAVDMANARLRGASAITAKAKRLLAASERFERSFVARKVLAPLGLNVSADRQRAIYEDARRRELEAAGASLAAVQAKAGLEAKQAAERKALSDRLSAATFERVKAALSQINSTEFAAMIERHNEEKRSQIEAHNTARAAAGMKPYQPRSKEAPTVEPQRIDKNRDLARQAFAGVKDAQQPQAEAPKVQAAYKSYDMPGMTKGHTPAAPVRQAEATKAAPSNDTTRTSFSGDELRAAMRQRAAAATEKANSPEAKAADRQRRADAIAKAAERKKGMGGPDF